MARKQPVPINKFGWHTFRHSFGTLLKANGEDVKTVQELLRHANSRITLEVYTQAVTSNKRAAQSKVVKMMVPNRVGFRYKRLFRRSGRPRQRAQIRGRNSLCLEMWAEVVGE